MNHTFVVIALVSVCTISGCREMPPSSSSPPTAVATQISATPPTSQDMAKAAAKDFADTLRGKLQTKMAADGAVEAISFCKTEAPRIAGEVQRRHGVRLGRVPVPGRQRNPSNVGAPWVNDVLADFKRRADAGEPVNQLAYLSSSNLPQGVSARFAKAIDVQPGCLACHGKTLAPPIADALHRQYPGDTATGFDVGDLRGLLWVEVPARP